MAAEITVRQIGGSRGSGIVVIRSDVSGSLALNTVPGTEGANATSNETVSSMTVAHIAWTGQWDINRGATTVFKTVSGSWGQYDFADEQLKLEATDAQETANLNFVLTGSGAIVLKMHKRSGA